MYAQLWNRFSNDHHDNCLAWTHERKPILPPSGNGWQAVWTANPDLLEYDGRLLLFYRGSGVVGSREGNHDRIGVAEVLALENGKLVLGEARMIVDIGAPDEFDGTDALDPATVVFQDKIFLYYSAIGPGPDSVGLAVSEDGVNFKKVGKIMVGRAPDVVVFDGRLRMIYQRADAAGNYQVYLAESSDGLSFHDVVEEPVFRPTNDSWDSLSIATVRLGVEDGTIYALYGGSSYLADEPDYFGLARSQDMIQWEFHPGNPVFGCGAKGSPDGGAIWFPALHNNVLLYEGSPGKYSWDLCSAICMAYLSSD